MLHFAAAVQKICEAVRVLFIYLFFRKPLELAKLQSYELVDIRW